MSARHRMASQEKLELCTASKSYQSEAWQQRQNAVAKAWPGYAASGSQRTAYLVRLAQVDEDFAVVLAHGRPPVGGETDGKVFAGRRR